MFNFSFYFTVRIWDPVWKIKAIKWSSKGPAIPWLLSILGVSKCSFELHIMTAQFTPEAHLFEVPEKKNTSYILNKELSCPSSQVPFCPALPCLHQLVILMRCQTIHCSLTDTWFLLFSLSLNSLLPIHLQKQLFLKSENLQRV